MQARSSTVVAEYHYLGEPEPVTGVVLNVPIAAHGETVDAADLKSAKLEGSNPSGPTIEEITAVTVAVGKKLFPDALPALKVIDEAQADIDAVMARNPFDRATYQREYMRDLPKAKAAGMTVAQWRKAQKDV